MNLEGTEMCGVQGHYDITTAKNNLLCFSFLTNVSQCLDGIW